MRRRLLQVALFSMFAVVFGACTVPCNTGIQLEITGPPNDIGTWTSDHYGTGCSECGQAGGPFKLDSGGVAYIPNIAVALAANTWSVYGNDGCMGSATWGNSCPAVIRIGCLLPAVGAAHGDATVNGTESETYVSGHPIWNMGTVSITTDGQTVSASYGRYSTATSVALNLAGAIQANPTLAAQFASAGLGTDTKLAALNGGSQYAYPWQTSCTYGPGFHSCSFWVTLQPSGSLTTQ
jgi:hypothetical protein